MGIYTHKMIDRMKKDIEYAKKMGGRAICIVIPPDAAYRELCGIYRIMFNKHFYIGKSEHIVGRASFHACSFRNLVTEGSKEYGKRTKLFDYLKTHKDLSILYLEILELCEFENLEIIEQYYIDKYFDDKKCLNTKGKSIRSRKKIRDYDFIEH